MILQELNRYYERLLADPERDVPARHWSVEKAAWELKLSRDGRLLGAYQLTAGTGKELRRFVSLRVPEHTTRSGTGMLPFFLCDNAAYLLGYDEKRGPDKLASAHALHEAVLGEYKDKFLQQVGNDLNTSMGVTLLYDALKAKTNGATRLAILDSFDQVLSLSLLEKAAAVRAEQVKVKAAQAQAGYTVTGEGDPEIDALVKARGEAKKAKNFAEADRIRDELKARGIEITDVPGGAVWKRV